jgi:hypothetical protein
MTDQKILRATRRPIDVGVYGRILDAVQQVCTAGKLIDIARIAHHAGSPRTTTMQGLAWSILHTGEVERVSRGTYRYLGPKPVVVEPPAVVEPVVVEPPSAVVEPPPAVKSGKLFEQVAVLEGGNLLLRCEGGDLYTAKRFEAKL